MGNAPACAREALDMVRAGLGYLAAADANQLSTATQAECLRELEQAGAVATAARASFLAAFTAGQGCAGDAEYSAVSWLMHRTGITRGAAVGHAAWAGRTRTHPKVVAALAARQVSESVGRLICLWTSKLPEKFREESDELLLAAAAGGLGVEELASLFAQMYERARGDLPDEDPGRDLADRGLKLATTFGGAGVIRGELTAECAEVVGRVLDALGAPAGKDDDRTKEQRYHDALAEAMRRLVASDLVPERAGQPVKAWVHISLADLLLLDGDSALQEQWTARVRERWAGCRAFASETGSDGGAWLDGDAAGGVACDAAMAPLVTGDVNVDALEDLIRLCAELDRHRRAGDAGHPDTPAPGTGGSGQHGGSGHSGGSGQDGGVGGAGAGGDRQGRGPAVRAGRAGQLPAAAAARGAAGRAEPAAGHRLRRVDPRRDPQRGGAAGPQVPVGRRLQPARVRLRRPPHHAQGQRRQDQHQGLRPVVFFPPPDRHPPAGLDPGPQPGRDDDRVEQGQDESTAQPRTPRPGRVTAPARPGPSTAAPSAPVPATSDRSTR